MRGLLTVRGKLKKIYGSYSLYINKVFQFVLGLLVFWCISGSLGYWSLLSSGIVILGAAFVCTFLPVNFTIFVAAVMILGHLYKLSLAAMAVGAVAVIILFIVYLRITPKYGFLVLLVPLCCALRLPYLIPIALGLALTPVTVIPAGIGVFMYYFVNSTSAYAEGLSTVEQSDMLTVLKEYAKVVFANKEMWLMVVAFVVVTIIVYILRRASFNYNWAIAIIIGVLANIVVNIIGAPYLGVEISWGSLLIGSIASIVVAFILQFLLFTVDYKGVKKVQFEDDEFYYYVKAVPKMRASSADRKLRREIEGTSHHGKKSDDDAEYDYHSKEFDYDDSEYTDDEPGDGEYDRDDYGYGDEEFEEER